LEVVGMTGGISGWVVLKTGEDNRDGAVNARWTYSGGSGLEYEYEYGCRDGISG
jgi:hypothetical protein